MSISREALFQQMMWGRGAAPSAGAAVSLSLPPIQPAASSAPQNEREDGAKRATISVALHALGTAAGTSAIKDGAHPSIAPAPTTAAAAPRRLVVRVVDDEAATAALERQLLEAQCRATAHPAPRAVATTSAGSAATAAAAETVKAPHPPATARTTSSAEPRHEAPTSTPRPVRDSMALAPAPPLFPTTDANGSQRRPSHTRPITTEVLLPHESALRTPLMNSVGDVSYLGSSSFVPYGVNAGAASTSMRPDLLPTGASSLLGPTGSSSVAAAAAALSAAVAAAAPEPPLRPTPPRTAAAPDGPQTSANRAPPREKNLAGAVSSQPTPDKTNARTSATRTPLHASTVSDTMSGSVATSSAGVARRRSWFNGAAKMPEPFIRLPRGTSSSPPPRRSHASTAAPSRAIASTTATDALPDGPVADWHVPEPGLAFASLRSGDLLAPGFILKRDLYPAILRSSDNTSIAAGSLHFRLIDRFNVGAVAQPDTAGIRTIINELWFGWRYGPCVWVNLRDDPHIYINGSSHSLRRVETPQLVVGFPSILAVRLEAMEEKLRREVLAEAGRHGGNCVTHDEDAREQLNPLWQAVDESTISTVRSVFRRKRQWSYGRGDEARGIKYARIPLSHKDIDLNKINEVFGLCLAHPADPIIFTCQTGRTRASFATMLACITRYFQHGAPPVQATTSLLQRLGARTGHIHSALTALIQVLPNGAAHEKLVALLANMAGVAAYSVDRMIAAFRAPRVTVEAINMLSRHCHLIVFARYCEVRFAEAQQLGVPLTSTRFDHVEDSLSSHASDAEDDDETAAGLGCSSSMREGAQPFSRWLQEQTEVAALLRFIAAKGRSDGTPRHHNRHQDEDAHAHHDHHMHDYHHDDDDAMNESTTSTVRSHIEASHDDDAMQERPKQPSFHSLVRGIAFRDALDHGVLVPPMALHRPDAPLHAPVSPIEGIEVLRQVAPDAPIFACGPLTRGGLENFIHVLKPAFPTLRSVHVIDVRNEPCAYIGGVPYVLASLRRLLHPSEEIEVPTRLAREKLFDIEDRLCADIISEMKQRGHVVCHRALEVFDAAGEVHADQVREETAASDLIRCLTPRQFFGAATGIGNMDVIYHRLPLLHAAAREGDAKGPIASLLGLGTVLAAMHEIPNDAAIIVLDNEGGSRCTQALGVATILRCAMGACVRELDSAQAVRDCLRGVYRQTMAPAAIVPPACYSEFPPSLTAAVGGLDKHEVLAVVQLGHMLTAGLMLPVVEALQAACGRGTAFNARDAIALCRNRVDSGLLGDRRANWVDRGAQEVRNMIDLFLITVYLDHVQSGQTTLDLEQWADMKEEIANTILKVQEHPVDSLKLVPHSVQDDDPAPAHTDATAASPTDAGDGAEVPPEVAVARRKGTVLTANFGLKGDHFPGCQKKGLCPIVAGAPNFRKVPGVNVYGVAIPTLQGVFNTLKVLGSLPGDVECGPDGPDPLIATAHPHPRLFSPTPDALANPPHHPRPERSVVVWMNLREEPLLYVNNTPYVFRDLANPFQNVELTGVDPEKVEEIELALRLDCLKEAERYNGRLVVHGETPTGALVPSYDHVTTGSIRTARMVYREAVDMGAQVDFVRLPVTDEQILEQKDFDTFVGAVLPAIAAFSQLGTGSADGSAPGSPTAPPTLPVSFVFNCQMGRGRTTTGMGIACMIIGVVQPDYYAFLEENYPPDVVYPPGSTEAGNGNYRAVRELQRLLIDGREAKRRTDMILDTVARLQNLRRAIEDLKRSAENQELSESARANARHVGGHYVVRYMYLIVFNSYLHEMFDPAAREMRCGFVDWMRSRRELLRVIEHADLTV